MARHTPEAKKQPISTKIISTIVGVSSTKIIPRLVLMQGCINPGENLDRRTGLRTLSTLTNILAQYPRLLLTETVIDSGRLTTPRTLHSVSGLQDGWWHVLVLVAYPSHPNEVQVDGHRAPDTMTNKMGNHLTEVVRYLNSVGLRWQGIMPLLHSQACEM